jgi:hypothetical protein
VDPRTTATHRKDLSKAIPKCSCWSFSATRLSFWFCIGLITSEIELRKASMVKYSSGLLVACSAQVALAFLGPAQVRLHVARDTTLRLQNNSSSVTAPMFEVIEEDAIDNLNVKSFMNDIEEMSDDMDAVLAKASSLLATSTEAATPQHVFEATLAPSAVRVEEKSGTDPIGAFSLLAVAMAVGMAVNSPMMGTMDFSTISSTLANSVHMDYSFSTSGAAFMSNMDFQKVDFSSASAAVGNFDFSTFEATFDKGGFDKGLAGLVGYFSDLQRVNPSQIVKDVASAIGSPDFLIAKSNLDNALAGLQGGVNPLQTVLENALPGANLVREALAPAALQQVFATMVAQSMATLQEAVSPSNQVWQDAAGRFASTVHPEEWALNAQHALATSAAQVQEAIPQAINRASDAADELVQGATLRATGIQNEIPKFQASLLASWMGFKEGMITLWEKNIPRFIGEARLAMASTATQIQEAIPQMSKQASDLASGVPRMISVSTDATVSHVQTFVSASSQKTGEVQALLSNVRVTVPDVSAATNAMTTQAAATIGAIPNIGAVMGSTVADIQESVPDMSEIMGVVATKVATIKDSVPEVSVPDVSDMMESVSTKTTELKTSLQDVAPPNINEMMTKMATTSSDAAKESLKQVTVPEVKAVKDVVTRTAADFVPQIKQVRTAVAVPPPVAENVQSQLDRMTAALLSN